MSARATPASRVADRAGIQYTLHSYHHDPKATSFGVEAATALGVPPERVFKTLVTSVDGQLVVAMVPVHRQLDLKALARVRGGKRADLAGSKQAQRATGYVVGGISPLGQRTPLPTVIDASATALESIFVSAGQRGLQLELAPADLVQITGGSVASIAA